MEAEFDYNYNTIYTSIFYKEQIKAKWSRGGGFGRADEELVARRQRFFVGNNKFLGNLV